MVALADCAQRFQIVHVREINRDVQRVIFEMPLVLGDCVIRQPRGSAVAENRFIDRRAVRD
jgi:hypothetical protein